MIIPPPPLEPRLQQRYVELVQSHAHTATRLTSGLHALNHATTSMAATQAAYRFFKNERVGLRDLAAPLQEHARSAIPAACDQYVLVVHDWSQLMYPTQTRKQQRLNLSSKHAPEGYELLSSLAVSDRTGLPLAPLSMQLRADDGVHDTRCGSVRPPLSPLDELEPLMRNLGKLPLGRPCVHVVDAEADSVAHYREWNAQGHLFLVRGDDRLVEFEGREQKCSALQRFLQESGGFGDSRDVLYHGRAARQQVAEVEVRLLRAGQRNRPKQSDRRRIRGGPLTLRLIIVEVRDLAGKLLATWYLLSNVPSGVSATILALWYYWRWTIESFFKLLKSAGLELEAWQQERPAALARRLLVACMSCVLVWDLARSEHPEASAAREFLVRLSGRQMKYGVAFTIPAMLAGLGILFTMLEALEHHSLEELQQLAQVVLRQPP